VNCTGNPEEHWVDFIEIAPGYMGPNALPVPEVSKGRIDNELRAELGVQAHFGDGDETQNLFTQLNINLAKDIASVKIWMVPVEHFNVNDATRDERKLSGDYYEAEGWAIGDVYLGSEVQILKNRKFPDVMLRAFMKTASSEEVGGARFTDSPGYYFDLSFGKTLPLSDDEKTIHLYTMIGFYSWQTYDNDNPQNDAPLYGIGADLDFKKFMFSTSLGGYSGWKDNRDEPLVYRFEALKKHKAFDILFQYQYGIKDFDYSSFKLSLIYHAEIDLFKNNKTE